MKKLIRKRFLPKDYERVLFTQYQNSRQGVRTAEDYTMEFHRFALRNNLDESEDQVISHSLCWRTEKLDPRGDIFAYDI